MGIVNLAQSPDILELNAFVQKFNISDRAFLFFPKVVIFSWATKGSPITSKNNSSVACLMRN